MAKKPAFGGKKGVPNTMRNAILKLRKEAKEKKKREKVLIVVSDPLFQFKGCLRHLGKENLVLLMIDGDLASKKEIIEQSHHYWRWEALMSGEDVEGRPNAR